MGLETLPVWSQRKSLGSPVLFGCDQEWSEEWPEVCPALILQAWGCSSR